MIVEMSRGIVAVTAVAVLAAGCGGHEPTQSNREWMANARGVVEQLRADVLSVSGFDELAAARRGLRDDSELYGLLVSYTDFGGCLHMVAAVGAEPPGRARVVKLLHRACLHLRRADLLFTSAVEQKKPRLLVAATREALSAVPVLDDVALELASEARDATGRSPEKLSSRAIPSRSGAPWSGRSVFGRQGRCVHPFCETRAAPRT